MEAFLGIDVSKGYADFVLVNSSLEELDELFQLDDTPQGHQALQQWCSHMVDLHKLSRINAAVESTGGFENNWYSLLYRLADSLPVRISRLNPLVVKNSARAGLKTQVTDALSAKNIAIYLVRYGEDVAYQQPENKYRAFRSLDNHIDLLTRQKAQLVNELKQLLYSSFPELQRYCKQSVPNWVLELLKQYPSAARLARAHLDKVVRIKGITRERAGSLINRAKNSVASRGDHTDSYLVQCMVQDIQHKQKRINDLKKLLIGQCQGPEVDLVQTIKGIGGYSAASLMVQIEDIVRFTSAKHLAGFFGLHPSLKESGDSKLASRMSKKGRPAVRARLYMCANSAVLSDTHMKSIYAHHRAKGKNHNQALGVIMHKLLRIIWGVLHSGKPYNPQQDQKNIMKGHATEDQKEARALKSKRRMQPMDECAPISRIATKRRKAYQTSQVSHAEPVRDLSDTPQTQT